jgi:hypothetical protein
MTANSFDAVPFTSEPLTLSLSLFTQVAEGLIPIWRSSRVVLKGTILGVLGGFSERKVAQDKEVAGRSFGCSLRHESNRLNPPLKGEKQ